ncbi:RNA 2'-phosphotransferase [Arthrobacter zhangbolii]|uniref:RNA 2'-phosphotransferase n=1 Tax=Arthrobacter zhangbolii TaxID=2886936 RepID=UPI003C2D4700
MKSPARTPKGSTRMTSTPSRSEISRVLSHALRHAPGEYGLVLDPEGWAPLSEVLGALHRLGPKWEGSP